MKSKQNYFLFIFSIFLIACNSGVNEKHIEKIDPADSIALAQVFQQVYMPGANEDSLLHVAKTLFDKEPLLEDVYQYNLLRNDIMKGRLAKADSALASVYNQYLADSLNFKWTKYLNLLASVSAYKNQQNEAVMYFRKALKLSEENDDKLQAATIRYNLANVFLSRTDYDTAHEYGSEAHTILNEIGDKQYLPMINGLLAVTTLHTSNDIDKANQYADEALLLSQENSNIQGLLLGYYAKGEVLAKQEKYAEAIEPLKSARELGEKFQQTQILISTGASLLTCYLGLKDYPNAIDIGKKTLDLARQVGNSDIEYSLNKNLGQGYAGIGDFSNAYLHTQRAEQEYREKSNKENQEIIQNLLISFESEKKNNIILSQENKLKGHLNWIILLVALSVLILSVLFFLQRISANKQKALEIQKEKEVLQALTDGEEMERSRVSGELHDGIGSQLTAIKLMLENSVQSSDSKRLLKLVQDVLNEVRLVAHNILPLSFDNHTLADALQDYCARNNTEELPINYFSNTYDLKLPKNLAHSLFRAVQELVQNAQKHANADHIHVQYLKGDGDLHLVIEDNGKGMDESEFTESDGLRFLKRRLESLGADFDLTSEIGEGTIARIVLRRETASA
ncbi:MAG: tetratricopeptide repeat protein [Porphyromonadaceae bacterium]|nr:tetratricopeptide repeat protein [Porphyromonadaceae bacterium]